jgi:hypothetical protein
LFFQTIGSLRPYFAAWFPVASAPGLLLSTIVESAEIYLWYSIVGIVVQSIKIEKAKRVANDAEDLAARAG